MNLNVNDENTDYIGDGAYAHIDSQNRLWVLTYNGIQVLDKICLDNDVFESLCRFYTNRILKQHDQDERYA